MSQKIEIQNIYSLTPLQEGILFHYLMDEGTKSYIEQMVLSIKGDFEPSVMKKAFQLLIDRHEVLRTVFRSKKLVRPLQVVLKSRKAQIKYEDISNVINEEKELILEKYCSLEIEEGFDLSKEQLFRITVLKVADQKYKLLLTFHHIILDGWSVAILLEELLRAYYAISEGKNIIFEEAFPFSSYISWMEKQNTNEAASYWNKYFLDYEKPLSLPKLSNKKVSPHYRAEEFVFELDQEITDSLREIAKSEKVTLNSVVQSLWGLLLHWYSQTDDILFGSVVSGRSSELPGIEKAVGMYINTVPVRMNIKKDIPFTALIKSTHDDRLLSKPYEFYPLYSIERKLNPDQDLINHVLAFENYPLNPETFANSTDNHFSVEDIKFYDQTHYDLNVVVFPGENITFRISFNSEVYDKEFVKEIKLHLSQLAKSVCENPDQLLGDFSPLSDGERAFILENGNGKMSAYPSESTVHEIFEMYADKYPSKSALKYGNKEFTYSEVNKEANQIAAFLRKNGLNRGEIVAILADRTPETIIGILAILKAGGAYLPIDPALPEERILYTLHDSRAGFLVGQSGELKGYTGIVINLRDSELKEMPAENLINVNEPADTAYVIYTSGTTGKPKGVMVEHQNIVRLLHNSNFQFNIGSEDIWTIFHSFSFDFSVWEMYGALLHGGKCVIVSKETAQNPKDFFNLLQTENVTVLNQTPSAFSQLIDEINSKEGTELDLRYIIFGGEALKPAMLQGWKQKYPDVKVVNMYGITETTVHVTYKEITDNDITQNISNIGKPIPTNHVYILNEQKELLPVGVTGELYVGGKGVAKGYLFRGELTKERFVDNPFRVGERMYKTGDLARMLPNGELEYLGRIDHQIKIRGHRIEMGEIENRLLFHPHIKEAAVLAYKDQTDANYLCAYVASAEDLSSADIRKYLAEFLPDYMVPAHFIFLSSLPLTANGKIDRNALPQPEMRSVSPFVEPQSDMERRLAQVWQEVLGLERIGIHDDFFELGGHSLRAAQLVNMIHKTLDMELPLKAVFEYPTIHLMAMWIEQENKVDKQGFNEIQPVAEQEHYPVSSAQKRMLILNQLEDIGTNYNITGAVQLNGALDPIRLEEAIRQVISRHEALRTSFSRSEDGFIQRVHPQVSFSLESWEEEEPMVPQRVNGFSRPFDLSSAPLLRAGLISMGSEKHVMVLDMHHIISDASSLNTILEEISLLYKGETLPPLRLQYKDVSAWQSKRMKADSFRKAEDFWLKELSGDLPVLDLLRKERPRFQSFEGKRVDFTVPKPLAAQLQGLAHKTGTTLFMVLLSAYQVLLSRYSGQEDILVGTPAAGRTHADLHCMVGMLGNTLPMRTRVREDQSFRALLEGVRDRAIRAFEHQTYPFDQMVEKVSIKRDMSRNPIFDCMFIMHDADAAKLDLENLQAIPYPVEDRSAKVDLALEVTEKDRELETWFQYSTALFSRHEIETISAHFLRILKEIVEDPDQPLSAVEMISGYERHNLLHRLNPREIQGEERPIHELFEAQAALTPARTAIVSEGKEFTYREINEQANRMARALQRKKVKKGDRIGVMVRRSEGLMTALLAVLKTGAAYVPIDPEYPEERIAFMAEDSGVKYVIADEAGGFQSCKEKVLPLSELAGMGESPSNPEAVVSADDLAYIIYTSGSTGNPKGVMVEHRSVQNFIEGMSDCVGVSPGDAVLALTTVSFDIFVTETFLPLAKGACVIMASEAEQQDPGLLSRLILDRKVSILQATPSRIKGLMMHPDGEKCLEPVRVLIMGGEALPPSLLHSLQAHTQLALYNAYGPTETTVWSTIKNVTSDQEVTIGRPIRNTRCYIVGMHDRLQPIGVFGELCIAGSGVSRGYLNQPGLTAEKFVKSPFEPGDIMYRTGDLARWLPDGQIEYAGRMDQQVKLRGYRIELKEIESHLETMELVSEAAAAMHKDSSGDAYLCGYLVWKDGEKAHSLESVKAELAAKLPGYMVPAHFVVLEELPLTANGKLDRKALPEPERQAAGYEAPETGTEKQLAQIWSEVLGIEEIGIHENFFFIGGQSLKGVKLVSEIYKFFDVEITIKDLFLCPTIYTMARWIEKQEKVKYIPILPAEEATAYPLTSAQKRLFILNEMEDVVNTYNMPAVLKVRGKLNLNRLQKAFDALIERHEILRTSFEIRGGEPVQRIHKKIKSEINVLHVENIDSLIESFIKPFDLSKAPLIRMTLITDSNAGQYLMLDMHHIISDGLSLEIMEKELLSLYQGKHLDTLSLQYKDYAVWQKTMLDEYRLENQEKYWLRQFENGVPLLELPFDYVRPKIKSYKGNQHQFKVEKPLVDQLYKVAESANATLFMILLSCYQITLARFSGQDDIVVGTPVSGRSHPEVHSLIGMFVNMLPIRLYPEGEKEFLQFLQEARQIALESFAHQNYPFEELIGKLKLERDPGRNPLFDASFVLQNKGLPRFQLEDEAFTSYPLKASTAKFDLLLEAIEEDGSLEFNIQYCTELFEERTIAHFSECFTNIIRAVCINPNRQICNLEIISETEKKEILQFSIGPKSTYHDNSTIQEVFEIQTNSDPDKIAVFYKGQPITYKELNEKANKLGHFLKAQGIVPEEPIAILMEPTAEMIISILAILKTGASYLPLNPEFPESRLKLLLEDSGARFILKDSLIKSDLALPGEIININGFPFDDWEEGNLRSAGTPDSLAYIMYTSGTTGKPKGVMVTHKNVSRLVINTNYIEFNESDQILLTGATGFDATTFEIWGSLLNGLTVHLCDKNLFLDAKNLSEYISKHKISILWLTSSLFNQYAEYYSDMFAPLRYLLVGGEVLSPMHIALARRHKGLSITNVYGPTENTTFSTYFPVSKDFKKNIPIGRPISNSSLFIVDGFDNLQPIGVVGEICVGGAGVAKGYLNNPELTAQKFSNNPFIEQDRIYRTGDLGKWLPDGNLDYVGRKDKQVKIRGYRIEPKEIEAVLLNHPSVKNAAVTVYEDIKNEKHLCAYYVSDQNVESQELRADLQERLPAYMVPAFLMELTKLPLTANGKLDKQALPTPDTRFEEDITLPRNEIEELLVDVFIEVLGVGQVSTNASFFDLGGDSIKALQISAKLHALNLKMEVKDLFKYPTIESISPYIKREANEEFQGKIEGEVRLTPIQKWFFEKQSMEHYWNQAILLHSQKELEEKYVKEAMKKLLEHHDALRMSFQEGLTVTQLNRGTFCAEEELFHFDIFNCTDIDDYELEITKKAEYLHKRVNLKNGPLVSLGLFKTDRGDFLLFSVHHLVIDGVSWRIIAEDFISGYESMKQDKSFSLPKKTASYQSWSSMLTAYSSEISLLKEEDYWGKILSEDVPELQKEFPVSENLAKDTNSALVEFSKEDTARLMNNVNQAFHTETNDILLTALALSLKSWTGNQKFLVNLEGHGREVLNNNINISRTVGWFTSIYPIMLDARYSEDKGLLIKQIKEMLRKIPNKGIGFGILKYLSPMEIEVGLSALREPQISFNFLGEYGNELKEPFALSTLPLGESVNPESARTHEIEILGKIVNGKLQFQWEYNRLQYSHSSIETWSMQFKSHLIELINFCTMKEESEYSPSDFGEDHNLSFEELEGLQDLIEAKLK